MPHLLPHPRSRKPRHGVLTPAAGSLALLALALTACTSTSTGSSQPVSVTASGTPLGADRRRGLRRSTRRSSGWHSLATSSSTPAWRSATPL